MSEVDYRKHLEKAEAAKGLLWKIYETLQGDSNLANYVLRAFKSADSLVGQIEDRVESGGKNEGEI